MLNYNFSFQNKTNEFVIEHPLHVMNSLLVPTDLILKINDEWINSDK